MDNELTYTTDPDTLTIRPVELSDGSEVWATTIVGGRLALGQLAEILGMRVRVATDRTHDLDTEAIA